MQSPIRTRSTLNRWIVPMLVLGLTASVVLNVVMLARSSEAPMLPEVGSANVQPEEVATQHIASQPASSPAQDQMTAQRRSAPGGTSWYVDMAFGQVDVMRMVADQRFAPTALDRFVIDVAP